MVIPGPHFPLARNSFASFLRKVLYLSFPIRTFACSVSWLTSRCSYCPSPVFGEKFTNCFISCYIFQHFASLLIVFSFPLLRFFECLRHVYFSACMWLVYLVAGVFIGWSSPFDLCTFMNFASDLARRWRSECTRILCN